MHLVHMRTERISGRAKSPLTRCAPPARNPPPVSSAVVPEPKICCNIMGWLSKFVDFLSTGRSPDVVNMRRGI